MRISYIKNGIRENDTTYDVVSGVVYAGQLLDNPFVTEVILKNGHTTVFRWMKESGVVVGCEPVAITNANLLEQNVDIIVHGVNCLGVMGAGIAKPIADRHPELLRRYQALCKSGGANRLGRVFWYNVKNEGVPYKYVANVFSQAEIASPSNVKPLSYEALAEGLKDVASIAKRNAFKAGMNPIGCGLAGGDWRIVENFISIIFEYFEADFLVFDIKRKA